MVNTTPHDVKQAARRTSAAGIVVNLALIGIKGAGGVVSGSQALIADAVHSLADLLTDVIAFFAVVLGQTEADETHPYGHGKFETFGTLVLSVFLAFTALGLGWHLLGTLQTNTTPQALGTTALVAAGLSVVLNEALFRYCLYEGKRVGANPIIANAWHHRADGLSSVAVFVGIGLNLVGFAYGDVLAAAVVVVFLLKVAYSLGRDAFDELVDAAIEPELQNLMHQAITQTHGVVDCHMLRARRLGGAIMVDAHVDVSPRISVSEGHHIAEMVEYNIMQTASDVKDVTIHIDPADHHHEPPKAAAQPSREDLEAIIKKTVKKHCPKAKIKTITLHFIGHKAHADVVFESFSADKTGKIQKAILDTLTGKTNKKKAAFEDVRLFVEL